MIGMIERWIVKRVTERALKRIGVLEKDKILEGLGTADESSLNAVLSVAAGREQEAREYCAVRGQSNEDLRYNSGRLADAVEFQEELIALVKRARERKRI